MHSNGFTVPATPREPKAAERDARIEDHGSIFLVRPLTDCALGWLREHTDGTWFGNALAVEHRFVADVVAGMRGAGFAVEAA